MWRENIKHYLNLSGRTQKDLAQSVNVTEATLSNYLNGKRDPHFEIVFKIAEEIGVSVQDLFDSPKDFKGLYLLPEEKEFILLYRSLSDETKQLFRQVFKSMKELYPISSQAKSSLEIHEGE